MILPIAALLVIAIPLIFYRRSLNWYKKDRLPVFTKKRDEILEKMDLTKKDADFSDKHISQLQKQNYFIDKILSINTSILSVSGIWKILYAIVPLTIEVISLLFTTTFPGSSMSVAAVIGAIAAGILLRKRK